MVRGGKTVLERMNDIFSSGAGGNFSGSPGESRPGSRQAPIINQNVDIRVGTIAKEVDADAFLFKMRSQLSHLNERDIGYYQG